MWGCSSAGRAPALQAGGQEFDSPHLHHNVRAKYAILRFRLWRKHTYTSLLFLISKNLTVSGDPEEKKVRCDDICTLKTEQ